MSSLCPLNKSSEGVIFAALPSTRSYDIRKFQREDLFITLFIVYSHIYTHLPKFVNILLYAEANTA